MYLTLSCRDRVVGGGCLPSQETRRLVWKLFIVVPPENVRGMASGCIGRERRKDFECGIEGGQESLWSRIKRNLQNNAKRTRKQRWHSKWTRNKHVAERRHSTVLIRWYRSQRKADDWEHCTQQHKDCFYLSRPSQTGSRIMPSLLHDECVSILPIESIFHEAHDYFLFSLICIRKLTHFSIFKFIVQCY